MKKQYTKPENTVVEIQLETLIADSIPNGGKGNGVAGAREVIQDPDAWEDEW